LRHSYASGPHDGPHDGSGDAAAWLPSASSEDAVSLGGPDINDGATVFVEVLPHVRDFVTRPVDLIPDAAP
jgi:hypothetical protein